jgi:hypothetical protein
MLLSDIGHGTWRRRQDASRILLVSLRRLDPAAVVVRRV